MLKTRRYAHRTAQAGFTIVELLIVVVVIAILAAITIVSYNGITVQATESSLKSDLKNASTQLGVFKALGDTYPASLSEVASGNGAKFGSGVVHEYIHKISDDSYCLSVTSTKISKSFKINSGSGTIQAGVCNSTIAIIRGNTVSCGGGSTCYNAALRTTGFDSPGTISVKCNSGAPVNRTFYTSGVTELSCYFGTGLNAPITATIAGWGTVEGVSSW